MPGAHDVRPRDARRTRGRRLTRRRRHHTSAGLPGVHLVVVSGPRGAAATCLPRLVARGCPVVVCRARRPATSLYAGCRADGRPFADCVTAVGNGTVPAWYLARTAS